jgi:predicted RNA-binding protein with PUA-like domain
MKNEPEDYNIDDLKRDKTEPWDGIRNYQVRNMIRDDMRLEIKLFFTIQIVKSLVYMD